MRFSRDGGSVKGKEFESLFTIERRSRRGGNL